MKLSRYARRYYVQELTTDLEVGSWEASFDSGATWTDGEAVPDQENLWRWLLRGPNFVAPDGDTYESILISTAVQEPLLRAIDEPEHEVVSGTMIVLT